MSATITAVPSPTSPAPAPSASPADAGETNRRFPATTHRLSVMCPMGITPYAAEGLTLAQPLFARVSYVPA